MQVAIITGEVADYAWTARVLLDEDAADGLASEMEEDYRQVQDFLGGNLEPNLDTFHSMQQDILTKWGDHFVMFEDPIDFEVPDFTTEIHRVDESE